MHRTLPFLFIFSLLLFGTFACSSRGNDGSGASQGGNKPLTPEEKAEAKVEVSYGNLIQPDTGDFYLIPVNVGVPNGKSGSLISDIKSVSRSGYDEGFYGYSWDGKYQLSSLQNLLFVNTQTGEMHPLTDEKWEVLEFNLPSGDSAADYSLPGHYLFEAITKDVNADGKINYKDQKELYVCDMKGANLRKISPDNQNVLFWKIDREKGWITLRGQEDVNGDGKMSEADPLRFSTIDLETFELKDLVSPQSLDDYSKQMRKLYRPEIED